MLIDNISSVSNFIIADERENFRNLITNHNFEHLKQQEVFNLWSQWFIRFSNIDLNSQILQTINILIQNVKDKQNLSYIFQHELMQCLIT